MHPSTVASPDSASNEPHPTYVAANKIIKKLSPDMVENIFKFISGEEVMRTTDIARILSYLGWNDIIHARRVSKKWTEAVKRIVPTSEFVVDSVGSFNTMKVMTKALPYLQQLSICAPLEDGHKYIDGEDPDERRATKTANHTTHDINIISNFTKLRSLYIDDAPLNGIYPVLSNFPLLQKLTICNVVSSDLKWNLEMLSGLPSLEELVVFQEEFYGGLSGNVRTLRVLKDTLEKVEINNSPNVEGNFMDLADFPRLKYLDLVYTQVTGDVRDINEHDFPALESLRLPWNVRGGRDYEFDSITEVPSFMHAIHRLLKRNSNFFEWDLSNAFDWTFSEQSPDWYDRVSGSPEPPFDLQIIQAGSRLGWSWCVRTSWRTSFPCEINWLDPEPSSESDDYEAYIEALQRIEGEMNTDFYGGYYEPPTEMEYRRLCDGLEQRD